MQIRFHEKFMDKFKLRELKNIVVGPLRAAAPKGVFFPESAIRFLDLQISKKYSKFLS